MRFSLLFAVVGVVAPVVAQRSNTEADQQALEKLLQRYDKDKNGKIDKAEYTRSAEAFANLDRDKNGFIDRVDFEVRLGRGQRIERTREREREGASKLPMVGELAPDFELPMLGVKGKPVKLSSFRGDRPVALIFGSYT